LVLSSFASRDVITVTWISQDKSLNSSGVHNKAWALFFEAILGFSCLLNVGSDQTLLQQILNHMNESAVYNEADVAPFQRRLHELRQIVQHDVGSGKHPEALTKLLERQLNECGQW
jgi:hypothetical protein